MFVRAVYIALIEATFITIDILSHLSNACITEENVMQLIVSIHNGMKTTVKLTLHIQNILSVLRALHESKNK